MILMEFNNDVLISIIDGEVLAELIIHFDRSILNRWVVKYAPQLEVEAKFRTIKRRVSDSWRMVETHIKVKGQWIYFYRIVVIFAAVIDFYLIETRDETAAYAFFNKLSINMV